ncbi:hypothetical protein QN277_002448 [Acacia crassicarpa]|uniref:Uncharacterized protein n=1 Tax=Acacia crassicarpa TaxID=499986 RepID=A0AAE1TJM6_9FABA|nr:hypothetical protein QN277_002448 [Acacia crassicarpa]
MEASKTLKGSRCSGGDSSSDMGGVEGGELAVAEAQETGEASQAARSSRNSIYSCYRGFNQNVQHAFASQIQTHESFPRYNPSCFFLFQSSFFLVETFFNHLVNQYGEM